MALEMTVGRAGKKIDSLGDDCKESWENDLSSWSVRWKHPSSNESLHELHHLSRAKFHDNQFSPSKSQKAN